MIRVLLGSEGEQRELGQLEMLLRELREEGSNRTDSLAARRPRDGDQETDELTMMP